MNEEYTKKIWVGGVCIHEDKILLIHRINNELSFNKEYFVFPGKDVAGDETIEFALKNAFADFSITIKFSGIVYANEDDNEEYYWCEYVLGEPAVAAESNEAKEMEESGQVFIPMWVPISEIDDLILYPESLKESIFEYTNKN